MSINHAIFGLSLVLFFPGITPDVYDQGTTLVSQLKGNTNTIVTELAAGQHSAITESFVFVARDPETHSRLRSVIPSLQPVAESSYETHAYVAIFLGQRRTGGFNIEVSVDQNGSLAIGESKPPPGAMLKMVLSAPFKVVDVSLKSTASLELSLDETWQRRLVRYRLTKIEGPLATNNRLKLQGTVEVLRSSSYLTCLFRLQEGDSSPQVDVVSAGLDANDRFELSRVARIVTGKQPGISGRLGLNNLTIQTEDSSLLIFTRDP